MWPKTKVKTNKVHSSNPKWDEAFADVAKRRWHERGGVAYKCYIAPNWRVMFNSRSVAATNVDKSWWKVAKMLPEHWLASAPPAHIVAQPQCCCSSCASRLLLFSRSLVQFPGSRCYMQMGLPRRSTKAMGWGLWSHYLWGEVAMSHNRQTAVGRQQASGTRTAKHLNMSCGGQRDVGFVRRG